jgi:hypothetical protein
VIFPGIVEERNTAIHGLPDEAYRGGLVRCIAEMMSAEPYSRDLDVVATELSKRNGIRHRSQVVHLSHQLPQALI